MDIFVAGAALIGVDIIFIVQSFSDIGGEDVLFIIINIVVFIFGLTSIFFGLFLRIVSEGVFLLMDIEDNTRRK